METLAIILAEGEPRQNPLAVHMAVCSDNARAQSGAPRHRFLTRASAFDWTRAGARRQFDAKKPRLPSCRACFKRPRPPELGFTIIDTAPHTDKEATAAANLRFLFSFPCRRHVFDLLAPWPGRKSWLAIDKNTART